MPGITRNQENGIIAALGGPVGQQLVRMLNTDQAAGNAGPAILPLINNTQLIYTADTD